MKIIRFIAEDESTQYGVCAAGQPHCAKLVAGSLFENPFFTEKLVPVRRILAPVMPPNILAIGLNYRKHADESKMLHPKIPVMFSKATTSVIGHGDAILLPKAGDKQVDFEGELAIVIGKKVKNVAPEKALEAVFGYTCSNDVSARDWQMNKQQGQWVRGKSFDTFCPLGPCIVTADEIPDPNDLAVKTVLNGELVQNSNTANMIFDVPYLISFLSESMTLLPGTVILTGTPEGVGFSRKPPLFLKNADTIRIEIERIGTLENRVESEFIF